MRYGSAPLLVNGSMSSSLFGHGIPLDQAWIYSIQALWSGPALGTLKLQISNDNVAKQLSGPVSSADPAAYVVNWTDYSGSFSSTSATSGSSNFMWNVLYPGYAWVRPVYTAASGSGQLSFQYFGKSS